MGGHIIRGLAKMQMQSNLNTSREEKKGRAESRASNRYRESCITLNTHDISMEYSNREKSFNAYTENTRNDDSFLE